MNNKNTWILGLGALLSCALSQQGYAQQHSSWQNDQQQQPQQYYSTPAPAASTASSLRIGIVNTKRCLEESKLGKQEQANFEKMKNQMESILMEKEKSLEDIEGKLNDDDWIDSVSEEAVTELRRKKKALRNEGMQLQNQYMQTLQQTNVKIIQKLTDVMSKASEAVAKEGMNGQPIDVIFTDEACTFYDKKLDISDLIIAKMNSTFEAEPKDTAPKLR